MRSYDVIVDGGITHHVEETGTESGSSRLFIDGYSTSGRRWIYQMDSPLVEDMHLVTMDTRGHGRSEKPADGYEDLQLWTDDIQGAIDELGLGDPVVVVSSMAGVYVSDNLSIHGGDDIAGINLVGGIPDLDPIPGEP